MISGKKSSVISLIFALGLLAALLCGCGMRNAAQETAPQETAADGGAAAPAESGDTEAGEKAGAETGRQDGERFDAIITLEGMEETVHCVHVRNTMIGFEMDYDYESFKRLTEADRECLVSVWDLPDAPGNYLELTYRAQDPETVAAAFRETLSQKYELLEDSRELERAGSCLRIEASALKGDGGMADQLQVVYIIPAADGCLVAAEHFAAEASEGFGRRFSYILNTLAVIDRQAERLSDEEALAAVRNYCFLSNPDLAGIVNAGVYPVYWELSSGADAGAVVLFRSYTGAQVRCHIDRDTGETTVGELVPGAGAEESRTDESFNARNYLPSIPGTWQTASVTYAADGTMQSEYTVLFTYAGVLYGHVKDGEFVIDHADRISSFERNAAGGYKVKAVSLNGVRYSYQTCESDADILEYFETWEEAAFPDMYRGGASLMKAN